MKNFSLIFSSLHLLALIVALIGICGIIFNYRNIIITLLSIELSLLGINILFIAGSFYMADATGLVFSIIILTVAAAEAAIGLAILVLFYRVRQNIFLNNKHYLRG